MQMNDIHTHMQGKQQKKKCTTIYLSILERVYTNICGSLLIKML
ncbi:hypothetical protein DPX39_090018600 [Trypanosoma brucei equiperdum]|uniref:Uncharacterized protein n=1 Tax=Trypanosoma brucei equiperdum TaxID=630700 RepID=A0A3L6L3D0_9TRYP|nr:hypothetical protein DPX39_090018600 [Trypanosoma brucei equiperdum]